MAKGRTWTEDQLRDAVKNSFSYRQVLSSLSLKPAGGNYAQLKKYIQILSLDATHFTGKAWNKGLKIPSRRGAPLSEFLVEGRLCNSHRLKIRLIKEGIFEHRCFACSLTIWMDGPIPLELDHRNGDKFDNRLENLRLLCPNCHALTATYRGKNKARPRTQIWQSGQT